VSKFDLRDISERLARSRDTEAVVFEFLGYLQNMRSDWRAALAFYEVSSDTLVNLYERQGARLLRRDLRLPVDQLPARLVRKFFHPSAFFSQADRRSILAQLLHASPAYEPDPVEAPLLRGLIPAPNWNSCVCLALADQEDVLALLVLASEKKNAFGSRAVGEIIPVKSIAALAIAQHLHHARHDGEPVTDERAARIAAAEFQDRIRRLTAQTQELEEDNRLKAEKLAALNSELENLDRNSTDYKRELERVKVSLAALEEQTAAAAQHLNDAYTQLTDSQTRMQQLEKTVGFMKEVFQVLAQEHDPNDFPRTVVQWFCEHFELGRCSLMLLEEDRDTLRIAAQQGIDPDVVDGIRVRVGQGVAGWVAHHKRPLFVRAKEEQAPHTGKDAYNSDSFISVPLTYNNRVFGVLNLSNKRDGEPFEEIDLDRALMAGSLVAMSLGSRDALSESVDDITERIRTASAEEIVKRVKESTDA